MKLEYQGIYKCTASNVEGLGESDPLRADVQCKWKINYNLHIFPRLYSMRN